MTFPRKRDLQQQLSALPQAGGPFARFPGLRTDLGAKLEGQRRAGDAVWLDAGKILPAVYNAGCLQ